MAFLDNSGDIILDAVLTDTGRRRLARGDGSFNIAKYALGDDEINYGSYDADNTSGSAYYDLQILQTPVLEAFTNNIASLKSKLISLTNNNLLYLPVIELNTEEPTFKPTVTTGIASGTHVVFVDKDSVNQFRQGGPNGGSVVNFIDGFSGPNFVGKTNGGGIRLDQGLDTNEISDAFNLDAELTENQYIIEIDNRFGSVVGSNGQAVNPSFVDDDNIASYYLSTKPFVDNLKAQVEGDATTNSTIAGPRGTKLVFSLLASLSLRTSDYLFDQAGNTSTFEGNSFKYIDTLIRVHGASTGYRVDVPVRLVKLTS
tara:strand:+ start:1963 stop:2904 length:942 start_codon:yes stop_codon:yes gene_type:complete